MRLKRKAANLLLSCSLIVSMLATGLPLQVEASKEDTGFVKAEGTKFTLDGSDFYYAGTNNYYINFKPSEDVDEVMQDAQDMGITVIRTWGHLDAGTMTDAVDVEDDCPVFENNVDGKGQKEGVYYQYWDEDLGRPVVNHGEDGLQKLDYVIAQAEKHNIKVILTLTNYWDAFGGMGQYCLWAGKSKSDVEDFYTDETMKGWFKNYIYEVLNHENVYTGRKLMDEPAIFAWELANEPRYNAQDKAIEDNAIYAWASEMSAYIKSIDKNHMVSVGDEGGMYYNEFTNHPGANTIPEGEAVNTNRQHWHGGMGNFHQLMQIDTIDFGTPHLYPGVWNMESEEELAAWLKLHADVAHEAGKPVILEEFGWSNKETAAGVTPYAAGRDTFFEYIYDAMIEYGYAGSNFWMLGAHTLNDAVGYYPDYDGFTVYNFAGPVSADGVDRYGTNEIIIAYAAVMNNMGNKNKLSTSAVSYDKANPSTCAVVVTPQSGAAIESVSLDGTVVSEGTAYSLSNNTITFKADYLDALEEGTYYATIDMTEGMSLQFTVEVLDSSIVSAVAGADTYVFDKNVNVAKDVEITVTTNDGGAFKGVYVLESGNTKTALSTDAYTSSDDSVTIKASYLINKETGDLKVILDYTKGTDPIVTITINDTTGKDVVDDFEGYVSDSELSAAWSRNTNGGTVTPSLVTGQSSSTAMKYDFNTGSAGYAGITKSTTGLAVTSFDGISFWIKAENTSNNDLTVQIREKVSDYSSIYWEKIVTWSELDAANGAEIKIPFEEFEPKASTYDGISQPEEGQVCGDNAVAEFSLYVGGSTTTNSFVIDDIKLYSEGGSSVVVVPTAAPTATPTVAPTEAPTATPTAAPTEAPTATPTAAPTATPTVAPTATPTVAPTETPTATPSTGVAYTGSVTITGANWWTSKEISKTDLLGNVDPSTVTAIKFSGNTEYYVGYNSTSGYSQPYVQGEYTATDMALENNYYLQICLSKNDYVNYTISWEVYTNAATPTAAPTATPTVAPTAAPTATPTVAPTATPTVAPTAAPTPVPTEEAYSEVIEFEDANRYEQNGRNRVDSSMFSGYSGDGYVYLEAGWGEVGFTVPKAGKYKITLVSNADSYKENWLYLDEAGAGTLYTYGNSWNVYTAEFDLSAGTHKFGVSSHWGYVALDYVKIEAVE